MNIQIVLTSYMLNCWNHNSWKQNIFRSGIPYVTNLVQTLVTVHLIFNNLFVLLTLDGCSAEIPNLINNEPIYISSPNYDLGLSHPKNIDCVWSFTDHDFGTYVVTVLDFSTYWKDVLTISYGSNDTEESQIAVLRGSRQTLSFNIPYPRIWIRFTSPSWGSNTLRGFLLEVDRDPEFGMVYNFYINS